MLGKFAVLCGAIMGSKYFINEKSINTISFVAKTICSTGVTLTGATIGLCGSFYLLMGTNIIFFILDDRPNIHKDLFLAFKPKLMIPTIAVSTIASGYIANRTFSWANYIRSGILHAADQTAHRK